MGRVRGFFRGFLSKDTSFATGIVFALMGWTLTRLVDGVTANNTIEYQITEEPATLADGSAGFNTHVVLTNLSADTAFTNLQAALTSPRNDIVFSTIKGDSTCAFESPGGLGFPVCHVYSTGYVFMAPMFLAGRKMEFSVKYHRPQGSESQPQLHLQPDSTNFRLVAPGFQTFVTRNQTTILLGILIAAGALLVVSVGAGISEAPDKK